MENSVILTSNARFVAAHHLLGGNNVDATVKLLARAYDKQVQVWNEHSDYHPLNILHRAVWGIWGMFDVDRVILSTVTEFFGHIEEDVDETNNIISRRVYDEKNVVAMSKAFEEIETEYSGISEILLRCKNVTAGSEELIYRKYLPKILNKMIDIAFNNGVSVDSFIRELGRDCFEKLWEEMKLIHFNTSTDEKLATGMKRFFMGMLIISILEADMIDMFYYEEQAQKAKKAEFMDGVFGEKVSAGSFFDKL